MVGAATLGGATADGWVSVPLLSLGSRETRSITSCLGWAAALLTVFVKECGELLVGQVAGGRDGERQGNPDRFWSRSRSNYALNALGVIAVEQVVSRDLARMRCEPISGSIDPNLTHTFHFGSHHSVRQSIMPSTR